MAVQLPYGISCASEFIYPGLVVAAVATLELALFTPLSRFLEGKTGLFIPFA